MLGEWSTVALWTTWVWTAWAAYMHILKINISYSTTPSSFVDSVDVEPPMKRPNCKVIRGFQLGGGPPSYSKVSCNHFQDRQRKFVISTICLGASGILWSQGFRASGSKDSGFPGHSMIASSSRLAGKCPALHGSYRWRRQRWLHGG